MAAFSVDLGWISLAKVELKSAADSAAIAAANQLAEGYVLYNLPNQSRKEAIQSTSQTTARTFAQRFAGYNRAGGVALSQVNDSDVQFGFTDAANHFYPASQWNGHPNTVRVTLRRDATANGAVDLFFGRLLGINSASIEASAAATVFTGTAVQSFRPGKGLLLPVALDVGVWNAYLTTQGQVPVSPTDPKSWTGGPGLENTLGLNFAGIIGRQRLVPLFTPVSASPYQAAGDQGSGAYYRLVGFGGATVSDTDGNGINMRISIQPCAVLDPTAIYQTSSVAPAGSGSSLVTTAAAPKLTQ
jgi:hypothetical protein